MSEVAQATHSSPDGHIPQLRFPGFSGVWRENRLGNIARIFDGTHQTPKYVENGIPFYSVEHITANQFDDTKYISEEVFERENMRVKLEREDILMTRIGNIGMAKYIDWNVNASFYVSLALIKKNESFNSKFLSQLIHSPNFQRQLWKRTIHVAFPQKINLGEIGKCESILPTKPEQQKIAAFLTTVDNKIEQLSKKQELLGEYKKGLMQQIFSQAIRFKADDGSDFPDWEEKRLEDVAEIVGGGTPPTAVEKYWGGDIQWFTPTEIKNKYIVNSKRTITQVGLDTSSARLLPKGTLLFSSRATVGEIGIAVQECTTNQGFQSFIVNKDNDSEFLYNWIIKNKKEFIRRASGSTFLEIGKSEIKKIKSNIPLLSEQQKIAEFLTAVDNKIEQLIKKQELLGEYKKGLMQQIFSQAIRFKADDGSDFPNWEEKKLGDVVSTPVSDGPHLTPKFVKQGVPFLSVNNLVESKIDFSNVRYISIDDHLVFSKKCKPKKGDVLLGKAASVGKVAFVETDVEFNIWSPIAMIRPGNSNFSKYIYYCFQTRFILNQISKFTNSSSQGNIGMGDINKIIIKLPNKLEQTKIANLLSSIDSKIEQVGKQLRESKQFKKALLQQMFV